MSNPACSNGGNYSSPVPVIGIYIAAGSLGCLLLMVYDVVVYGIRIKKQWLPCKFFALNSVTLTLLAVAAKLTVDLTTPMPGRWYQLSKLTGTAFICVGMGFIVPSIGKNSESECLTNMMALTIFVITVTVNICIQLSTGVIFMFFIEHIIILGLMLLLLLMLWHVALQIKFTKRLNNVAYTSSITQGSQALFERLKQCFLCAYCFNPQFQISSNPMNIAGGSVSIACTGIIIEVTFRSLIQNRLDFCQGFSDYSWSMHYIVIIQIVTIILGPVPIAVRGVAMFSRMELDGVLVPFLPNDINVKQMKKALKKKEITLYTLPNFFGSIITMVASIAQLLIVYPPLLVRNFLNIRKDDNHLEYFGNTAATCYLVRKSIDEMIRLMDEVSSSGVYFKPSRYLTEKHPSPYLQIDSMKIKDGRHQIEINSLTMALLVKIAEAFIPKDFLVNLLDAFHEAKEVIDYINEALPPRSMEEIEKRAYAETLWISGDLTCLLSDYSQPSMDHMVALDTIKILKATLDSGEIWYDLGTIINFIIRRNYSSIGGICEAIEQLFADMLHALFAQLPTAIVNSLSNTQEEELEERVGVAMKLLFKIESLDCQFNWMFSAGMSCIVNDDPQVRTDETGILKRLEEVVLVRRGPDFQIITCLP